MDKAVQCLGSLGQASAYSVPVSGRYDSGYDVEGPCPINVGSIRVNREADAHLFNGQFSSVAIEGQGFRRLFLQPLEQPRSTSASTLFSGNQLIEVSVWRVDFQDGPSVLVKHQFSAETIVLQACSKCAMSAVLGHRPPWRQLGVPGFVYGSPFMMSVTARWIAGAVSGPSDTISP